MLEANFLHKSWRHGMCFDKARARVDSVIVRDDKLVDHIGARGHRQPGFLAHAQLLGNATRSVRRGAIDARLGGLEQGLDGVECGFPFQQHMRLLAVRSEEHTSELQSLMRISYAVFCLKKKK